ncbi:MAG: glycosyltransferase, partial [Candidatus Aminicenantes bacterium]|nr:glycosyltransferase [Candidatus Aminicenantes bacterium]
LPQQLDNFKFSRSRLLKRLFVRMERLILRTSHAVIVICQDLLDTVRREGFGEKAVLVENVLDFPAANVTPEEAAEVRRQVAPGGERVILYAGNLGPYQGIELLLEAFARVREKAILLLVGGSGEDLERMKTRAAEQGLGGRVVFWERVAPQRVPLFIAIADVLVSPRLTGTNTPLKVYSYLKSGKPVVATNLYTHTQVLNERISVLVEPTAEGLAGGLTMALTSPEAQARARAARDLADREYTFPAYLERMNRCLRTALENQRRR